MKVMWDEKELIKLIKQHSGEITPEQLLDLLDEGDNITIELVDGKIKISASGGSGEITPEQILELIDDSDSIVVDINEDGQLEFNLNATLVSKINRALLLPLTTSEFKLIGVDNVATKKKSANATEQKMVGIDSNTLEIDSNNKLKVKNLYRHEITLYDVNINTAVCFFTIISTKENAYTLAEIKDLYVPNNPIQLSGQYHSNGLTSNINVYPINYGAFVNSSKNLMAYYIDDTFTRRQIELTTINDRITKIL